MLPPVNGHGPQAQVDEVAAGASKDEHCHIASYLVLPGEQTGHQRDENEDIQAKARDQKEDFRGGTKVQVDRDSTKVGRCLIHGRQVKATAIANVERRSDFSCALPDIIKSSL